MNQRISLALAIVLALALCEGTALAQRAGGRAGGARPGAGAQAGARPAFNRTPSFNASTPAARPQAPAAAQADAAGRSTGSGPGSGGARPSSRHRCPLRADGNRPGLAAVAATLPNQGNRPGIGGSAGIPQSTVPASATTLGTPRSTVPASATTVGNAPNLGNRPGIGNNAGTPEPVNRPGIGNNAGNNIVNRPGIGNNSGNNIVNRPGIGNNSGNNIVNRPGIGNNSGTPTNNVNVGINRPGGNVNSGNNLTINNVNNNCQQCNVNRPSWTNGNPNWAYRPGWSNHQSWVNGYWHGQNNSNWWNNGGAFMTGLAVGGIGAWGIGSAVYNWGYRPYVNPYLVSPAGRDPATGSNHRGCPAARAGAATRSRGRGSSDRLFAASEHQRGTAGSDDRRPGDADVRCGPCRVQGRQLRRGVAADRPGPQELCPVMPRSTSSARSVCSRSSSTTRPPQPSTRCSRQVPAGTGPPCLDSTPAWTSTPSRCTLWRIIAPRSRNQPRPGLSWRTTTSLRATPRPPSRS